MGKAKSQSAAAANQRHQTQTSVTRPPATPNWPSLSTAEQRGYGLPLELVELLDSQIVLVHNFFTKKTCSQWLEFLSSDKSVALQPSPAAKKGEAQRSNYRYSIEDADFADRLWRDTGLADLIADECSTGYRMFRSSERTGTVPIGLNPNIRIYRYEPGQSFAPHYDDTVRVGKNHTEWTLLIYLSGSDSVVSGHSSSSSSSSSSSDAVVGGETAFYPSGVPPTTARRKLQAGQEDVLVETRAGLALLHRHGRQCLLHEGRPVVAGVKWVLRSDVVFGPPSAARSTAIREI